MVPATLNQKLQSFSLKGADSKYFRFCEAILPLLQLVSSAIGVEKQPLITSKQT